MTEGLIKMLLWKVSWMDSIYWTEAYLSRRSAYCQLNKFTTKNYWLPERLY